MRSKNILQFLERYSYIAIGLAAGLAMCAAFMYWMSSLDVHQLFARDMPDRVYVSTDCTHCQAAIAAITEHPGAREIAIIPVDAFDSPERERLCAAANRTIRATGALRVFFLSEAEFCRALVKKARAWVEMTDTVQVPAWVIGGDTLAPGWTKENVAQLQHAGLLSDEFEIP